MDKVRLDIIDLGLEYDLCDLTQSNRIRRISYGHLRSCYNGQLEIQMISLFFGESQLPLPGFLQKQTKVV